MSRHILDGYDPTSNSWLADLNLLPQKEDIFSQLDIDAEAHNFIRNLLYKIRNHDMDPERCARKKWVRGAFTLVTFNQAVAKLVAQNFRCAVTANKLTFTKNQLNTMRCAYRADCFALTVLNTTFCSLDAIDPGKPHTADNVQWVCTRINLGDARALVTRCCGCACALVRWQQLILCQQASAPSTTVTFVRGPATACGSQASLSP
jgi:hypothetical protein